MSLITNTWHLCLRQLHAHPYASTCSHYFIPPKKDTCVCQKKIRHGVIGCFIRTTIVLGEDEAKCCLVRLLQPANEVWGKVIFSQACLSVHGGVSVQGEGSLSRGGLCQGGLCPGSLCQGDPRTVKSGRYASYWIAFLYLIILLINSVAFCLHLILAKYYQLLNSDPDCERVTMDVNDSTCRWGGSRRLVNLTNSI